MRKWGVFPTSVAVVFEDDRLQLTFLPVKLGQRSAALGINSWQSLFGLAQALLHIAQAVVDALRLIEQVCEILRRCESTKEEERKGKSKAGNMGEMAAASEDGWWGRADDCSS